MTYFDSGDLTCLDLDLYLIDQKGRIARLATMGSNTFPALLTQTVHDIINYYFHSLAKRQSKYTELFRTLVEPAPEITKELYYRDAELGIYCFDRGADEATSRAYRLTLVPDNPLSIDEIPEPVHTHLANWQLPVSFEEIGEIPDSLIVPEGIRSIPKLSEEEKREDQLQTDRLWREMIDTLQLNFSVDPKSKVYQLSGPRGATFCPKCFEEQGHFVNTVFDIPNWGQILFFRYHFLRGLFLHELPFAHWSKKIEKCPQCDFRTAYDEKLFVRWKGFHIRFPACFAGLLGITRRDF